ncbi:MAG: SH3 domain-containing protein [Caldilineaceae bacterium]
MDAIDFSESCDGSDRFEYDDGIFLGHYDLWENCGGTETNIVFLAAIPTEQPSYVVLLGVQMPSAGDFAVLDEIFKSFNLNLAPDGLGNTTPTAEVVVDALNVRSGPGTNYGRIGGVSRGEQLIVIGEYNNCGWLNVQTRERWVGSPAVHSMYALPPIAPIFQRSSRRRPHRTAAPMHALATAARSAAKAVTSSKTRLARN